MEGLLPTLLILIAPWDYSFPRKRSADRAKAMCISLLMTIGRKLFTRTLCACKLVNESHITVAFDDNLIKKSGKKIKGCGWQRDSASPQFSCNFVRGIRYLQASILLPLYHQKPAQPCRSIPVQITQLPKFKKPRKKASKEEWDSYYQLTNSHNSSTEFVKQLRYLCHELDLTGLHEKQMVAVVDASFVNQTCLLSDIKNTSIVGAHKKKLPASF